jgi:hypothetical protein
MDHLWVKRMNEYELVAIWICTLAGFVAFLKFGFSRIVYRQLAIRKDRVETGLKLEETLHYLKSCINKEQLERETNVATRGMLLSNFVKSFRASRKAGLILTRVSSFPSSSLFGILMNVKREFFTEYIRTSPLHLVEPFYQGMKEFRTGFIIDDKSKMYEALRNLAVSTAFTIEENGYLKPKFSDVGASKKERMIFSRSLKRLAEETRESDNVYTVFVHFSRKNYLLLSSGKIKDKDVFFAILYLGWIGDTLLSGPKYFGRSVKETNQLLADIIERSIVPLREGNSGALYDVWEKLGHEAILLTED